MYSSDYPVEGCYCCDEYDPVADGADVGGKGYDIYQACVDPEPATDEAVKAAAANGGAYQHCFNKINVAMHNKYRGEHKTIALNTPAADATKAEKDALTARVQKLARKAAARAKTLEGLGELKELTAVELVDAENGNRQCGESLRKLDGASAPGLDEINYANSALLSKIFYAGADAYDFATHSVKSTDTQAGLQFAQLLWADTTEVGFGISGKFVVARYCKAGNTPLGNQYEYAKNVADEGGLPICPKQIPGLPFDNCFNTRALTAANLRRGQALAGALKLDTGYAAGAQTWADELEKRGSIAASGKSDGRPDGCAENVFEQTDPSKRANSAIRDDATDAWYAGNADYDFATHRPKSPDNQLSLQRSNMYTQLAWKASTKAGFGISKEGRFIVMWVCDAKGNVPDTAAAFQANVIKNCINADGVNTCYNDLNLKVVNELRKAHAEAPPLTVDLAKAKELQFLVDKYVGKDDFVKKDAAGKAVMRPPKFQWEVAIPLDKGATDIAKTASLCAYGTAGCYAEEPLLVEGFPTWYYRLKTKDTA